MMRREQKGSRCAVCYACSQGGTLREAFVLAMICFAGSVALSLALAFAAVGSAWADDETEGETKSVDAAGNVVNVNQMPDSSFLYNTDISELSGAESFHDMQLVQVSGEVVGDHINDEFNPAACWITLQSLTENDASTVAVFMTDEQASIIDSYGNYNTTGTELQVRGIYYLSCPEHQGLSDLHAQEVIVEATGAPREHEMNPAIVWSAVLAVVLGVISFFTYRAMSERRK